MIASLSLFWFLPGGVAWMDAMCMFLIGFSIFGPQMLIGISAAELSTKKLLLLQQVLQDSLLTGALL